MQKFKLGIAITICILLTIASITLILINNKKELLIKLDSNPSTGYAWTYSVSNPEFIRIDESYKDECKKSMTGCAGQNVYKITALKEGNITINFTYSRSWENDTNPINAIYELTIDKNLKISETHSGTYFNN